VHSEARHTSASRIRAASRRGAAARCSQADRGEASAAVSKPLQPGDQRAVEALEPSGADALELREAALGVGDQAVHIDAHAAAAERLEVADPPPPEPPRPVRVPASQVLEAHADLQDPLVEVADRVGLLDPLQLERLVLLEELAAVELLDAPPEARRWRVAAAARRSATAGSVSGRRGSDHRGPSLGRPGLALLPASGVDALGYGERSTITFIGDFRVEY
jgi:hypothetical protein